MSSNGKFSSSEESLLKGFTPPVSPRSPLFSFLDLTDGFPDLPYICSSLLFKYCTKAMQRKTSLSSLRRAEAGLEEAAGQREKERQDRQKLSDMLTTRQNFVEPARFDISSEKEQLPVWYFALLAKPTPVVACAWTNSIPAESECASSSYSAPWSRLMLNSSD